MATELSLEANEDRYASGPMRGAGTARYLRVEQQRAHASTADMASAL